MINGSYRNIGVNMWGGLNWLKTGPDGSFIDVFLKKMLKKTQKIVTVLKPWKYSHGWWK
jgi:hypothetical protein